MKESRENQLFELIITLHNFEQYLAHTKAYISAILKVTERLEKVENNQKSMMEDPSTLLNRDETNEPNKPTEASETNDENEDDQNSLQKEPIKLIKGDEPCPPPVSSSILAIKSRCSALHKEVAIVSLCHILFCDVT